MSVLIKGMEMPHNCFYCKLSYLRNERLFCSVNGNEVIRSEVSPKCPIIEVPTPHGDLIDRDALIKDGWLNLHKEVMRMGGYAIHELPLKNPSIPIIIEAENE